MPSRVNTDDAGPEQPDRRRTARRRTYNRRQDDQSGPPYFEIFERIATSLEHIEELLRTRSVDLVEPQVRQRVD